MKQAQSITEQLKAENALEWTGRLNNISVCAGKIMNEEIVYRYVVISNSSDLPIYAQIKKQVKEQILSGEFEEDEMLPSLRQLAKDLKISVLTTTRAYNELEEEGLIPASNEENSHACMDI